MILASQWTIRIQQEFSILLAVIARKLWNSYWSNCYFAFKGWVGKNAPAIKYSDISLSIAPVSDCCDCRASEWGIEKIFQTNKILMICSWILYSQSNIYKILLIPFCLLLCCYKPSVIQYTSTSKSTFWKL